MLISTQLACCLSQHAINAEISCIINQTRSGTFGITLFMKKTYAHISDLKYKRMIGSMAISGRILDAEDSAMIKRVAKGQMSIEDAKAKTLSRYGKKARESKSTA
jgi:hypothetical protein